MADKRIAWSESKGSYYADLGKATIDGLDVTVKIEEDYNEPTDWDRGSWGFGTERTKYNTTTKQREVVGNARDVTGALATGALWNRDRYGRRSQDRNACPLWRPNEYHTVKYFLEDAKQNPENTLTLARREAADRALLEMQIAKGSDSPVSVYGVTVTVRKAGVKLASNSYGHFEVADRYEPVACTYYPKDFEDIYSYVEEEMLDETLSEARAKLAELLG